MESGGNKKEADWGGLECELRTGKHGGRSEKLEIFVKGEQKAPGGWEESLHLGPAGWGRDQRRRAGWLACSEACPATRTA